MKSIDTLLASYPRSRPPLTPAHEAIYVQEYRTNREGSSPVTSVSMRLEQWMHRAVAEAGGGPRVLEVGAGTLNHLPYESGFTSYDVIEPFAELWQNSPQKSKVTHFYNDVAEIPEGELYDRVLSIAVLEHLVELPAIVCHSALRMNRGGRFQAGIPSEGGALWGFAWRTTTGFAYRLRTGLLYATVMRHEHVNTAPEINAVLQHFFGRVRTRRFPLPLHHLSFYTVVEATEPDWDRCRKYLEAYYDAVHGSRV